jgi:hypothetical protein
MIVFRKGTGKEKSNINEFSPNLTYQEGNATQSL